jgi:L-threonylcarbamoyladenylate synthase
LQTEVIAADRTSTIARAVELLRAGEVIALPTETVYGLAADALKAEAVAKIFEAKERPRFDPVIVHLPDRETLEEVALVAQENGEIAQKLIGAFWPGPLTLILARRKSVPDIVTAGLDTVAVRMSAHPVFAEIAAALGRPLAAPSANRFGRISPTSASHVADELGGRIPLIVDAGSTEHGIESTIVRIVGGRIKILRRGPISETELAKIAPTQMANAAAAIVAPGQTASHYAPRTKLIVVNSLIDFAPPRGKCVGALSFRPVAAGADPGFSERAAARAGSTPPATMIEFAAVRALSNRGDLREAATNLFQMLRELDGEHLDLIVAELVPEKGIGAAINDRLRRASGSGAL